MSAVRIINLSKQFKIYHLKPKSLKEAFIQRIWRIKLEKRDFWALQDLNLDIETGQSIGIIGSNGSGKSTLLKLIAGIYSPTNGNIEVQGQLAALLELGAGFHLDLTGRENILINGVMLGLSRKKIYQRMEQIIEFAELEQFIDNPVKTYSSGMYMRLGFSIAVNIEPDILLVDEVLAVGDYSFQKKCFEKMDEFKKNRKTIILVSHDLSTVENFCSQAAWLHHGKLMVYGQVKNVLHQYRERIIEDRKTVAQNEHLVTMQQLKQLDKSRRWGTREIEITEFQLFDKNNKEKYYFDSGESLTLVINFIAWEDIPEPIFAIGIYRSDGICCYGTNTGIENIRFEKVYKGAGKVLIEIARLDLVEGKYYFDLAVQSSLGHYYDFHYQIFSMIIQSKIPDVGIYRIPHRWVLKQ